MNHTDSQWNTDLYNTRHSFVYTYGEELIALLQPEKNERILDLGCGTGQLTDKIAKLANDVLGLDKSPEMIKAAETEYKHITFMVGDATDFSFEEKFDAIFSNAALHWVTNCKGAVKCMYDNLRKNGRIVLEFGGKGNVETIVSQLRRSLIQKNYTRQATLQPWYFPSIGEYTSLLEAVGFRVMLAQHFDRPTELADKDTGVIDWLSMFAERFFQDIPPDMAEEIKKEVQASVKDWCFKNGKWYADYKRIRILAVK